MGGKRGFPPENLSQFQFPVNFLWNTTLYFYDKPLSQLISPVDFLDDQVAVVVCVRHQVLRPDVPAVRVQG